MSSTTTFHSAGPATLAALGAAGAGLFVMQHAREESDKKTRHVKVDLQNRSDPRSSQEDPKLQYVIEKLEEGDCVIGVGDVESFKEIVEKVFEKFPEKKVFLRDKFDQCIAKAYERKRESDYVIRKLESGECVIGEEDISRFEQIVANAYKDYPQKKETLLRRFNACATEARNKGIEARNNLRHSELNAISHPWTTLRKAADSLTFIQTGRDLLNNNGERSTSDDYILQAIEKEDCANVVNLEEFKKIVGEAFERHPAKSVFLQRQYQKCLEKIQKENGSK